MAEQLTIDHLFDELLQEIFKLLPARDLIKTHSTVCKRWYDILKSSNWSFWYSLLLRGSKEESDEYKELFTKVF